MHIAAIKDLWIYIILICGMAASLAAKKLTLSGAFCGGLVGILIFKGAGYTGIAMLATFFLLGTLATAWKRNEKLAIGAAEKNKGRRTAWQVLANSGVAAALGIAIGFWPHEYALLRLMMASALASATADTLSSELGMVYGRRFYHVLTLQEGQRGLDGIVSTEGTLIGMAGALVIAVIYGFAFGWTWNVLWIVFAANTANFTDSVLGATLERSNMIGNNMVNLLNTLTGALVAYLIATF